MILIATGILTITALGIVITVLSGKNRLIPVTENPSAPSFIATSPALIANSTLTPISQQQAQPENTQAQIDVSNIVSPEQIKNFLIEKIGVSAYGSKVFCAYQIMGSEQENQIIKIYLWAVVQEYYVKQQSLEEGAGTSEPVVIFVKMQDGKYQIFDYKDAGVGYQYLEENFPPSILPLINLPADEYNQRSTSLSNETRKEAKAYFGVH